MGTDVWADGAEEAALRLVEEAGIPSITNGMGRGVIPGGHPLLVTKARGAALGGADLVVVAGTPLDFRLGYGVFGGKDGATPARVVHLADSPGQVSQHADLAAEASGDLTLVLDGLRDALAGLVRRPDWSAWVSNLQDTVKAGIERDAALLAAEADPIHPARIYGELVPRLAEDAIVIGDGGDFVSFAGKYVEPKRPGGWLDPGPYGCLGAGLGVGHRRPPLATVRPGRPAVRRRRGRHVPDGRRHAGPAQPAGRDGLRQQLGLGAGEAADADALRVRRGRRPRAADPLRRGGQGPRRGRRDDHRPAARSGRRSTGPSPRTSPTWST